MGPPEVAGPGVDQPTDQCRSASSAPAGFRLPVGCRGRGQGEFTACNLIPPPGTAGLSPARSRSRPASTGSRCRCPTTACARSTSTRWCTAPTWSSSTPGGPSPGARAVLDEALDALGATAGDVRRILVTHVHRDHYTQAVYLRREFGIPVSLGIGDRESLAIPWTPGPACRCRTSSPTCACSARATWPTGWPSLQGPRDPYKTGWEMPDDWLHDGEVIAHGDRSPGRGGHARAHPRPRRVPRHRRRAAVRRRPRAAAPSRRRSGSSRCCPTTRSASSWAR